MLRCSLQAGFRESGVVNIHPSTSGEVVTPLVAVRSTGLAFESLVGFEAGAKRHLLVSPEYLQMLVDIANERFVENEKRKARFRAAFLEAVGKPATKLNPAGQEWEDKATRRERMKAEGLQRRAEQTNRASELGHQSALLDLRPLLGD